MPTDWSPDSDCRGNALIKSAVCVCTDWKGCNVSFWGHLDGLTVAGQTLPSHCPLWDAISESCCELSATCCAHFPSFAFCLSAGYIPLKTPHPWWIPLLVAVSHCASDYASPRQQNVAAGRMKARHCCFGDSECVSFLCLSAFSAPSPAGRPTPCWTSVHLWPSHRALQSGIGSGLSRWSAMRTASCRLASTP